MGKKQAYKLGSVTAILSKTSSETPALDPKLCDIFSDKTFKNKPSIPIPSTIEENSPKKNGKSSKIKKEKKPKDVNLSHKDAAAIRVESKKKFQDIVAVEEVTQEEPQKKKKHRGEKNIVAEKLPASVDNEKTEKRLAKKLRQKEKKAALKAAGKLTISKNKKNKNKIKTTKKEAKKEVSSDEEEDDKSLSKFPQEMDKAIAEFEKEQSNSEAEASDDEAVEKEEETKPKKLKNFELNTPKNKDPELESRTVFVGNLPTNIKEKQLKQLFKPFGDIETIRLRGAVPLKPYLLKKVALYSKKLNPDQYNISAYIRFKTKTEAEKAKEEMNGQTVDRHNLVVDIADNKKRDNKKAIFVGNIPLSNSFDTVEVEDDLLRKFFSECGEIDSVRIIRDATTGLSKGFGYVNFQETDAIELALKKDGENFEGRPVRVARHVKKEKKTKDQNKPQRNNSGAKPRGGRFEQHGKRDFQGKPSGAARRIEKKNKAAADNAKFTGDKLAEARTLKRKSSKPNKGDLKKAKIAAQLTGISTTQGKKIRQKTGKRKL